MSFLSYEEMILH